MSVFPQVHKDMHGWSCAKVDLMEDPAELIGGAWRRPEMTSILIILKARKFQMFSPLVLCAIFPMTVDESDGIFGLVCFMTELITACGYCKNVFLARSSP